MAEEIINYYKQLQDKLFIERKEVSDRCARLENFLENLEGNSFKGDIETPERNLMKSQLNVMKSYRDILTNRIDVLEGKIRNINND